MPDVGIEVSGSTTRRILGRQQTGEEGGAEGQCQLIERARFFCPIVEIEFQVSDSPLRIAVYLCISNSCCPRSGHRRPLVSETSRRGLPCKLRLTDQHRPENLRFDRFGNPASGITHGGSVAD